MKFYTADLHLFHFNIIRLCNRPYKTAEEMNEDLIAKWNAKVKPEDEVYICGDLVFKATDINEVKKLLKSLNGKKYLVQGNHDVFLKQIRWQDYFIKVDNYMEVADNNRFVILSHYPIESGTVTIVIPICFMDMYIIVWTTLKSIQENLTLA